MTAQPSTALPADFDPTDPDLIERGLPHQEWALMRRTTPVHWVEQEDPGARAGFFGTGYWAASRHAEVAAVSRNSADWSTAENGVIVRFSPTMTREEVEAQNHMMINHDDPEHAKMRRIVSRGFTPRAIALLEEKLRERSKTIIAEAVTRGEGDFVRDIAAELPLQAIADLLGVPQEDREKLFDWSNQMMSYDDPEIPGDAPTASVEILMYFDALANDRRENPRDDIITKLITADLDGEALTNDEFGFFVILLTVAGNETTRNAISHGLNAFMDNRDQWELWKAERPETMVDEVIRWATPITVFQRTALRDLELGGQQVKKGDRVGMFYASANFDEEVFTDPFTFDITRNPNPHVAFGGHGAHYCIGANLARMEVGVIFDVLADLAPDIRKTAEPRRLRSGWLNAIKELQVSYTD
jgi:cholest-4-en-3-one 26-monooxygenase